MKNNNTETDEAVYRRYLANGDENDLRTLLTRHREELTFFLYGILHNMEDSEELMLDTYAVAASGTSKFSGKSSFKTWLFAIGRNLSLKRLRKIRFGFLPLDENIVAGTGIPDVEILGQERNSKLYEALEKIKPEYRNALHLAFFENMSSEEISVVLKKNVKQVYNLVSRGKAALKTELEKTGYHWELR